MSSWKDYLQENGGRIVDELAEFVTIPSVSALPKHRPDLEKAAAWVARRLTSAGMEHTRVMTTSGHPAVYADWLHAGVDKPTILLYGHFDVQPADPIDLWHSPPFEPRIEDDRMYGRGASDDKGGMLTPIIAAEALMQSEGRLPVNVKFCFEGEEEIGSPSMDAFLKQHKERFACDLVLSADGLLWDADQPAILLGLKGLTGLEISVKGAKGDLHSGLHGGVFNNPIEALTHIIASMRGDDGRITIEGFFDDVVNVSDEDRLAIARVPFDGGAYLQQLGVPGFFGEPGYSTRERNWIRPTLELNGIWGGFQGEGTKTVIPSEAHAKITCRLVANQDPEKIFELIKAHVETHTPPGVRMTVKRLPGRADPYLMAADAPGNRIASEILKQIFNGCEPYQVYVGGSIPITTFFRKHLGADTVNFGWSVEDENLHAPNEFFRLRNFRRGMEGYCLILHRLAQETSGSLKS